MSRFIESIQVEDQKLFRINLHQKRLETTFANFGKICSMDLATMFMEMNPHKKGLYKWRIVYDLENNFNSRLIPYVYSDLADFQLVENDEIDYNFKSEDRKSIDSMKSKAKAAEIIIVKNKHITDSSFANLLFLKDKTWYTPSTFLLNGTQRQHLLETKKIREAEITLQNIKSFSHFQIINCMNTMTDDFVYSIQSIINLP
ncbi:MAG: aminotransferase class IV [Paludibacteraceae bacterium]